MWQHDKLFVSIGPIIDVKISSEKYHYTEYLRINKTIYGIILSLE